MVCTNGQPVHACVDSIRNILWLDPAGQGGGLTVKVLAVRAVAVRAEERLARDFVRDRAAEAGALQRSTSTSRHRGRWCGGRCGLDGDRERGVGVEVSCRCVSAEGTKFEMKLWSASRGCSWQLSRLSRAYVKKTQTVKLSRDVQVDTDGYKWCRC